MPLYPYNCETKRCSNFGREVCVFKPCKDSSRAERCPKCNAFMARTFSVYTPKEFNSYFDEVYKTDVTSRSQERKLMKQHGHIFARDAFGKKYEAQAKEAKWKKAHGFAKNGAFAKKERTQA